MSEKNIKIMAIDDYQNQAISDDTVSIFVNGNQPTVSHAGFKHFNGLDNGANYLTVESDIFGHYDAYLDLTEENDSGNGVIYLRLQPTHRYPLERNVKAIWGRTEPGKELHFVFIDSKERYFLGGDYTAGDKEICIQHQQTAFFNGTLWSLQSKDGQNEEFWIEKAIGRNIYSLRYQLNRSYEKGKCLLRRVYPVIADESGDFFLPVPKEEENVTEYRYYMPLDKRVIKTGTL
ncbi:MAG: hypothetical protein FWC09_07075 [Lachnospiraceae bacterium]|nr:hypothetical protein [Lachnospiraceae bacterium]